jgi:hypothetical protein
MMGLGLCIVGMGLVLGVFYQNLKPELAYLLAGLLFFSAGQLIRGKPGSN